MMKGRRFVLLISILLAIILLGLFVASAVIYNMNFNRRFTTSSADRKYHLNYPHMAYESCNFASNTGHQLSGWKYSSKDSSTPAKAVIVFAHGFGAGGQIGYLSIFDSLTKAGYLVFAYDATGNDVSEGKGTRGLPQGVIDLEHAIRYARTLPEYEGLPFILMGYSWGAYSVANVLNFCPDVQAAVTFSGFNRSVEIFTDTGRQRAGILADIMTPFVQIYEFFRFGKYACVSGISGFRKTDAPVLVVHSKDDGVVPTRIGIDKYQKAFSGTDRITFLEYEEKGHDIFFIPHTKGYDASMMEQVIAFLDAQL